MLTACPCTGPIGCPHCGAIPPTVWHSVIPWSCGCRSVITTGTTTTIITTWETS